MHFDQNLFSLAADERKLLVRYRKLDQRSRQSLNDYVAWLVERTEVHGEPEEEQETMVPVVPADIPRPQEESVVKAIKRLSKTYHMVDTSQLFNQTSSLMTQHLIQGKQADVVIDELEDLFLQAYNQLQDKN